MKSVYKVFFGCMILIFLMKFVPAPHIDVARWNTTSVTEGDPVKLIVIGPGLEGFEITFQIFERDAGGIDQPLVNNPSGIRYSGSSSYAIWTAEYHKDNEPGERDPPEYYFVAAVTGEPWGGMTSSTEPEDMLQVNPRSICGDGIIQTPYEECDDGSLNGVPCPAPYKDSCTYCSDECEEVVVTGGYCGDGNIDSPNEVCDNSGLNGVVCVVLAGESSCVYCSDDCTKEITITSSVCGDDICNKPTENCKECPEDCGACIEIAPLPVFGDYSFLISAALVLSIYFLISIVKKRKEENLNKNLKKKKTSSKKKGKKKVNKK